MTSDMVPGAPQRGRSLRTALMASLALNVLIIGGVAGTLLFGDWGGHGRKGGLLLSFARTLPADRADMIRQKVESEQDNLERLRKAERDARAAARELLTAEPYDQAKLKAALDEAGAADAREKNARLALFAATVAELTPEERRQLHDWLQERRKRRGGG